jgi:glycosyltransferase involved in cell wall biosynthesis
MTTVGIIIPTYNRRTKVARAIASVLNQTYKDYEIIVVDDASIDGTRDSLVQFRKHIRCVSHPRNLGVSASRNTAIKASRSPFIAFLDSDDYWLPEKLSFQMAFFAQNPEALICQTQEIWIRKGRRVNPQRKHLKPSGDIFEPSLKRCLVSPSAVMLRRSLLGEVGLFDESLPACEDYDLWLRIASRYPVYLIEQPLVVREGGEPDQLSLRHRGMDRFRIRALEKLIRGRRLNPVQLRLTFEELSLKCAIYGNGCLKRGKTEEGAFYLQLPDKVKREISIGQKDLFNFPHS